MKPFLSCLVVFGMVISGINPSGLAASGTITAPSVVLLKPDTKEIIYSRAPHRKQQVASTTKVVTALVVVERLDLDEWVTVDSRVESAQASKLYLKGGDQLRVRDLLKAILLKSANDAAEALAIRAAGSERAFARLMNLKVRELGAAHSHFLNASGLPEKGPHYSTAYDLALIMSEARKNSVIVSIMKQKSAVIRSRGGRRFYFKNHNKMLWQSSGVIGKTGWTRSSRHCFLGLFQSGSREAVVAMLGSHAMWSDLRNLAKKFRRLMGVTASSILSTGSRGARVRDLQIALKRAGYFRTHPTGYYGTKTKNAVMQFQRAHRLRVDGLVGSETRRALSRL